MNGRNILSLLRCSSRSRYRNGPSFGRKNYRSCYSSSRRNHLSCLPRFGGSSGSGHLSGKRNYCLNSHTMWSRGRASRSAFLSFG